VSQPPIGDNRRSIIGGELFKGLRDAMSRDKLNAESDLASGGAPSMAAAATNGNTSATGSLAEKGASGDSKKSKEEKSKDDKTHKDKEKEKVVGRRKSLKHNLKGKVKKDQSPNGITPATGEPPERQCSVM
jgi:hypothetical protein